MIGPIITLPTDEIKELFKENTFIWVNETPKDININIKKGETIALVGEPGSATSTILNSIAGLLRTKDGLIRFDENRNLSSDLKERNPNDLRIIQLIFQNPDESLNPNHTVEEIIAQPLKLYFGLKGEELKKCSEFANACGALAVSRHGCAPSYPSIEELNYFISFGSNEHSLRKDKKLEQIHLMLGFEGIDYYHDDYYSLEIYDSLIGGGMSSRLFQEIREKRGLVYDIHSFSGSYTDTGIFGVGCGTGETQIKELMPILCDELNKSLDNIVEKEVNRGKAQLKVNQMMRRERANSRCTSAAYQLLIHNRVIEPSEIIKKIDEVSIDTVKRVAKKIISGPIAISSIGPIKNLENIDQIQNRFN